MGTMQRDLIGRFRDAPKEVATSERYAIIESGSVFHWYIFY